MIEILGWGCFFGIIGFGLGKLKLHASTARIQTEPRQTAQIDRIQSQSITAWAAIYTQSTILHNEITKYISTLIIATLGVVVTLVAYNILSFQPIGEVLTNLASPSPSLEKSGTTIVTSILVTALLWVIGPTELLAHKQRELADSMGDKINNGLPFKLPLSRPPLRHFIYQIGPFILLVTSIILLLLTLNAVTQANNK